ncbi:MAG: hypothetical protein EBU62_13130 [Proteobacteria bacterium]|nr:hypothetical protein [Pseudomonadota bacterium]
MDLRRGWDRDLEADLTRLRSVFGIDVIVSLMEPWEYDHLAITDLATRSEALGMAVILFPIKDRNAPGTGTEDVLLHPTTPPDVCALRLGIDCKR